MRVLNFTTAIDEARHSPRSPKIWQRILVALHPPQAAALVVARQIEDAE